MSAEDFVIQRCGWEAQHNIEAFRRQQQEAKQRGQTAGSTEPKPPIPQEAARFREPGEVHKWMYDRYSLSELLRNLGFTGIKTCAAGESAISDFKSYHLVVNAEGTVRKPGSLFMEAVKPPAT